MISSKSREFENKRIAQLFNSEELRVQDIATQLSMPTSKVARRIVTMQTEGVLKKKVKGSIKFKSLESIKREKDVKKAAFEEELERKIINFRKKGYTVKKMTEILGLPTTRVGRIITRLLKQEKIQPKIEYKNEPLNKELIELFNEGFTYKEIGEYFGLSLSKIKSRIHYLQKNNRLGTRTEAKNGIVVDYIKKDKEVKISKTAGSLIDSLKDVNEPIKESIKELNTEKLICPHKKILIEELGRTESVEYREKLIGIIYDL